MSEHAASTEYVTELPRSSSHLGRTYAVYVTALQRYYGLISLYRAFWLLPPMMTCTWAHARDTCARSGFYSTRRSARDASRVATAQEFKKRVMKRTAGPIFIASWIRVALSKSFDNGHKRITVTRFGQPPGNRVVKGLHNLIWLLAHCARRRIHLLEHVTKCWRVEHD